MALLQVREFPNTVYQLLAKVAEQENRSITQQTIYMLSRDLNCETNKDKLRRKSVLDSLAAINVPPAESIPPYTQFLREDRERDEGCL